MPVRARSNPIPEKAVLIGAIRPRQNEQQTIEHLDELQFLAETAGAVTVKKFMQKLAAPDPSSFIGSGKLNEIAAYVKAHAIDLVIFDDDLTGTQIHTLERALKVKVLDRSTLILDIFASRARSAQAKAQVALAQLQYLLPRLKGLWTHLERQRGGIGMRGPGEKEIETDRRIVKQQIALLKEQLARIDRQNRVQRNARTALIRVALVGYTNVGKSTLMNVLSKSDVFAENKLFATLDTTTRKVVLNRMPFLLSDTVGFIRKLPHHLIESFKSTLDEVREADLLLHVVDVAHPHVFDQIKVVQETLRELDALDKRMLMVFNKIDLYEQQQFDALLPLAVRKELLHQMQQSWMKQYQGKAVFISATKQENIDALKQLIYDEVHALYQQRYPYRALSY